ncbi:ribosome hibernation factor-recruiting GTPase MRF [Antrihabitans cavernicola]|uniref:Cobalamin biosynthesis protein CobW n=1 Tax=Antrihabitans cavernicola TaxID=2495913 RepID=A0A5A7SH12_9NOCA|nr:GTP-binding protein [Spelaeibacter cavernicola]KAA0023775.1 cobalamin biosynthesis protein CobW [Spelaeibacter cavernicola]
MDGRTPVVVVTGWSDATAKTARSLLRAGTVVVEHDLGDVHRGVVRRTVTSVDGERTSTLDLAHCCVSCTLRDDLLPLLRRLSARSTVDRIVLALDRILEPEAVCAAIADVVVSGVIGQVDGPAARDVRVAAVVGCIDAATWLDDATGDDALDDRGIVTGVDDERTVAQVVVGQVSMCDAVVVSGSTSDGWEHARLHAVLARLAPGAPVAYAPTAYSPSSVEKLLAAVPAGARRGASSDPHDGLLCGQPPLDGDAGVTIVEFAAERPFHPVRLHDAIDVLLDGVVTARGRVWVATQPNEVLWLESAGGGLRVGKVGNWLAAMTVAEQEQVSAERRAMAASRWHERFGDRHTSLVVLVHAADPTDIDRALQWALVTDDELANESAWATWPDPFGEEHRDPCGEPQQSLCGDSESPLTQSHREDQA